MKTLNLHKRRPSSISNCNSPTPSHWQKKSRRDTSTEPARERRAIEFVVQDHTIGVVEGSEPAESVHTTETVEDTTGSAIEESTAEPPAGQGKEMGNLANILESLITCYPRNMLFLYTASRTRDHKALRERKEGSANGERDGGSCRGGWGGFLNGSSNY